MDELADQNNENNENNAEINVQKYVQVELAKIPDKSDNTPCDDDDDYKQQSTFDGDAPSVYRQPTVMLNTKKWLKLMTNLYFWIRIFLFLLTSFLAFLSSSYCIAQLLQTKLDLITICPEPKSREEIWKHSYSKYDEKLTEESQYGLTDEPCLTTNKVEINTKQLWDSNTYIYEWKDSINAQCIFFGLVAFYSVIIVIFMMLTLIRDIIFIANNTYHKTNKRQQSKPVNNSNSTNTRYSNKCACVGKCIEYMIQIKDKYFHNDTKYWMIMKFLSEMAEIALQSQALWLYNGYYIFDPDNKEDTYLANKPKFISLFAGIIAFNCFGSGLLWLFYCFRPNYCFGLRFERFLFFVDRFSDFLYIIFPFIILYGDDYNVNTDQFLVLLAQLNIDSALGFLATFIPLFFLVNKCLLLSNNAVKKMKEEYYEKWKILTDIVQNNRITDYDVTKRVDIDGKISVNIKPIPKHTDRNWVAQDLNKQIAVITMALLLIGYGMFTIIYITIHNKNAQTFCASIQPSVFYKNGLLETETITSEQRLLIQTNPELFVWDKCSYKVYPFVNEHKYRCQCRVFVMENWSNLKYSMLNITQQTIINGALQNWFMLEKFKTNENSAAPYTHYQINASLYNARYMKAFEWTHSLITNIDDGISYWKELEYFVLENTFATNTLPQDFSQLTNIKVFSLESVGLESFPLQICNLTQMQILQIFGDYQLKSLPHCISNLRFLKQILLDALTLGSIPLDLLNLDSLIEFSLYGSKVDYQGLLEYNLPSDLNINDTIIVNEWFNDNFNWNHNAIYWLQQNPICDDKNLYNSRPQKWRDFISSNSTKCDNPCKEDYGLARFCQSRWWGDGECNPECNLPACDFDGGDCVQLCFSDLSDCSWQLFTNDECDDECNNEYCTGYLWKSDFETPYVIYQKSSNYTESFTADNTQCGDIFDIIQCSIANGSTVINAPYLDIPPTSKVKLVSHLLFNTTDDVDFACYESDIDDGICYDQCRTKECWYDGNDCNLGCVNDYCHDIYTLWLLTAGPYTNLATHETVCDEWIIQNEWIDFEAAKDPTVCKLLMIIIDFNEDQHINFREFTFLLFTLLDEDRVLSVSKAIGANCSACIGMEHYNMESVTN